MKVTIPADIINNGIVIEVDGVEGQITLQSGAEDIGKESKEPTGRRGGLAKGNATKKPRSTQPLVHDPGGPSTDQLSPEPEDGIGYIPTPADLAQSFLQSESEKQRDILQSAIVESQLHRSMTGDDEEEGDESGIGTGVSIPGFLAGFLKGIADRLEVKIRSVQIDVDVKIDVSSPSSTAGILSTQLEPITLRLVVEDITLERAKDETPSLRRSQIRRVLVNNIQGMMISDPSLFAALSHNSGPPSPEVTRSSPFQNREPRLSQNRSSKSESSSSSAELAMAESTIFHPPSIAPSSSSKLEASIATSDGERFADAGHEPDISYSRHSVERPLDASQFDDEQPYDYSLESRGPRLHGSEEVDTTAGNTEDSDTLPPKAFISPGGPKNLPRANILNTSSSSSFRRTRDSLNSHTSRHIRRDLDASSSTVSESFSSASVERSVLLDPENFDPPDYPSIARPLPRSDSELDEDLAVSKVDSQPPSPPPEDLSQSRIFSHEEAESMYMSAISHVSIVKSGKDPLRTSGFVSESDREVGTSKTAAGMQEAERTGLSSDLVDEIYKIEIPELSLPNEYLRSQVNIEIPLGSDNMKGSTSTVSDPHVPNEGDNGSQRSEPTSNPSTKLEMPSRLAKHFVFVDSVVIELTNHNDGNANNFAGDEATDSSLPSRQSSYDVPGAFSGYQPEKPYRSVDFGDAEGNPIRQSFMEGIPETKKSTPNPVGLKFGNISLLSDMALTRSLILAVNQFFSVQSCGSAPARNPYEPNSPSHITANIERFSWKFVDILRGQVDISSQEQSESSSIPSPPTDSETLLRLTVTTVDVVHVINLSSSRTTVSVGTFKFGYAHDDILSFDSSLKMRESTRDTLAPPTGDILLTMNQSAGSLKIDVTTLPVHITLDMARLDETFSWFGGLSSVLGLGSSMMSTVTVLDARKKTHRTAVRMRGVRFQTSTEPQNSEGAAESRQNKITARIGGLSFELLGKQSSLHLESTAMKFVSRPEGVGLQIDKVKFSGPHLPQVYDTPTALINVTNIRLEYLSHPKEVDLARLLALLPPSRDEDGEDDDILLDTLLRQRRHGGVLRITIEKVEGNISRLDELEHFSALAEEVGKLSTVAKYLPEDDRPGILTLLLLRDVRWSVFVNSNFGLAKLSSQNVELAHVSLPLLVLLGVSTIGVHRQSEEELIGEAIPFEASEGQIQPSMILIKLIGDEMEPTIRVKIFNTRFEYHVSTVMAIMGIVETASGEIIVTEMISSIATLTGRNPPSKLTSRASTNSDRSIGISKSLKFDVAIRDCVIGLNPRDSPSRGLFVFSETRIAGTVPNGADADIRGMLEIKKAALMLIDRVENLDLNPGSKSNPSKTGSTYVQRFAALGYVSVSEISAAKVTLQMLSSGKGNEKLLDIEIRDDLFVLESCADSTHTLQSVLNGLQPPMPPSQQLKYRTEIIPVQDMLASFSGDAYAATGGNDGDAEHALELDEGDMMNDDVPQNLEFVSSFYNPDATTTEEGTANSILEGDLSSAAGSPRIREIGRRKLLQSFEEQYEVAAGGEPLDFRENHFGVASMIGGTAHRWNSDKNTYDLTNEFKIRGSPLRLRVRDVHFIWKLFDGYDWQSTRDAISQAIEEVEIKAKERMNRKDKRRSMDVDDEEESVIGDFLFNSIYIGIPANRDPADLTRLVNRNIDDLASETGSYATSTTASGSPSRGASLPRARRKRARLTRSKSHKMQFELKGVSVDLVVFPLGSGETQSSIDIRVQDLDIFDHVPTSTWKKFATYMHDAGERETGTSMVHIEILNVKPVPDLAASEIILKVSDHSLEAVTALVIR